MTRQLIFVFLGSLLFQVVQIAAYPILITQVMAQNDVSALIIGLCLAISWIVILVLGPFVPFIIHRLGSHNTQHMASALALAGLGLLVMSHQLIAISSSALLMGSALILRWINCDAWVVALSSDTKRGRIIGLHEALMGLGIGLGPLLFAPMRLDAVTYVCFGLLGLGQMAFWLANDKNLNYEPHLEKTTCSRLNYRMMVMMLIAAFVAGFIENSAIALFPVYFAQFNYPLSISVILVSAFGFGGTLLQPPLGALADWTGYQTARRICVLTIGVSCGAIIIYSQNITLAFGALFMLGAAAGGLNTLAVIEAGQTMPKSHIPAAMTAIAMFYTLGSVLGPVAAGGTFQLMHGTGMALLFASVAIAFGGIDFIRHARGSYARTSL